MKRALWMNRAALAAVAAMIGTTGLAGTALAQEKTKDEAATKAKAEPKLKVGDAAPPLKAAKWFKGTEVKSFEKGQPYVVEMWATWCGPCRAAIPHITEMAAKNKGKVTVVGMSIWENKPGDTSTAYQEKVEKFVKDMGEKMEYNIACDDTDGTMSKTWMEAAGKNGIPCSFVVDKEGKIAWIGHPMNGLDEVVAKVIDGTFDAKAEAQKQSELEKKQREGAGKIQAIMEKYQDAMEDGKYKDAVKALDELFVAEPRMAKPYAPMKFMALLKDDEKAAYAYAKQLGDNELKDEANGLNTIAWQILDDKGLKNPDIDLALALSTRSNELTKNDNGMYLDTLALAYFKKGNVDKAIELQTKAVAAVSKNAEDAPEDMINEMKERLEQFKKAKK